MEERFIKKLKQEEKRQNRKKHISEINNNNGITLIALVITIIVLLILAGVTINLTLGENGIFKTAEMAGKNYTQAEEQELAGLANLENEINNIIGGRGNNEAELPENSLKRIAKPGDYVKYDTGIDGIGENRDGIVIFRVLYNNETNGLQIISDKNVEDVTLGKEGTNDIVAFQKSINDYNNAIATLNQKAARYAESSPYALDGRCVGSVPTVGADGKFNAKNTEVEGTYSIPDEWTLPSGWSSRDTGCQKWTDTNYETDRTAMEAARLWTTGENYWLASRIVDSTQSYCSFYVRYVINISDLSNYGLSVVRSDNLTYGYSYEYGLRPCISLKPDVKVVGGGDGSSEAQAYELGI